MCILHQLALRESETKLCLLAGRLDSFLCYLLAGELELPKGVCPEAKGIGTRLVEKEQLVSLPME